MIDAVFENRVHIQEAYRCRRSLRKSLTQRVFGATSDKTPNFVLTPKLHFLIADAKRAANESRRRCVLRTGDGHAHWKPQPWQTPQE